MNANVQKWTMLPRDDDELGNEFEARVALVAAIVRGGREEESPAMIVRRRAASHGKKESGSHSPVQSGFHTRHVLSVVLPLPPNRIRGFAC